LFIFTLFLFYEKRKPVLKEKMIFLVDVFTEKLFKKSVYKTLKSFIGY